MSADMPVAAAGAAGAAETGSIYDIGYRKYDGPRLGRAHAVRSLFFHSLRSSYGIGRGGRAKIAPLVLGFLFGYLLHNFWCKRSTIFVGVLFNK
jgi:hypothetical protein